MNHLNSFLADIDCGALSSFDHGAIILAEHRTSFGAQAQYTCHENYTLIGNENRTCGVNGWSGTQPQCLVDWCPDPIKIGGGTIHVNGRRAGATAVYKCDPGYVLIGDPVRKPHFPCKNVGDFNIFPILSDYILWLGRRMEWKSTNLSIR